MKQFRPVFRNRLTRNDYGMQFRLYVWLIVARSIGLLLVTGIALPAHAIIELAADSRWSGQRPDIMLAGVIINQTDTGNAVLVASIVETGQLVINLKDFCEALNLTLESTGENEAILTPIGRADFPHEQLSFINAGWYAPIEILSERLVSPIEYSASNIAIMIQPVWPLRRLPVNVNVVQPDKSLPAGGISAPKASLSQFRTELQYQFRDPQDTTFSTTDIAGSFLGGLWQARYRNFLDGDGRLEDYTYLLPGQNQRVLLGNQSISVTPLLRGFEFTGAQYAWTNQPDLLFDSNLQLNQLIASPFSAIQNIAGQGPPGGVAELRVEGQVLAREVVRLDGSYVFEDIEVAGFVEQQIEVWLYRNRSDSSPEQIIDHSRFVSNETLPAGTFLQHGGVGVEGNLIEGDLGDQDLAGFYRARYAPTNNLVLEAAYQNARGENAGTFSALANLGHYGGIAEASFASDGDSSAWSAESQNQLGGWFWRGALRHEDGGYLDRVEDFDHRFIEVGSDITESLQLSVVARDFEDEQRNFDYVLPAARWRPTDNFSLRIRPDFEGDYTLTSFYGISPKQRLTASLNEELSTVRWDLDTSLRRRLSVQGLHRQGNSSSIGVTWQQFRARTREIGWAAGLFYGSGNVGFLAQADYEWVPGLYSRAEVFRDPLNEINGRADTVYTFSLVADFSLFNGGFARGRFQREFNNRGAIAGRLKIPENYINGDLVGVGILVNGQLRGKTQSGGNFAIQSLPPGIYSVRLDIGELPLELSPINSEFWAEVAGGSITQIDFDLQLQLGFAGQIVTAADEALADVVLQIHDSNGQVVTMVNTNSFGFYRVDGLPPGNYEVMLLHDEYATQAKSIQLSNQFLFQQDIRIN